LRQQLAGPILLGSLLWSRLVTRIGRDGWKKLIEELEKSELTHKEFAAEKGVELATLQFWLYKLRRESRHESRPSLLPVEVIPSAALKARQRGVTAPQTLTPALLEVTFPSGMLLRFTTGTDVNYVRQLLAALG
jgi:hypothetical protein